MVVRMFVVMKPGRRSRYSRRVETAIPIDLIEFEELHIGDKRD